MKAQVTLQEYQKGRALRVWDMIFVAPFLVMAGSMKSNLPQSVRVGLVLTGIGTFLYNAASFYKNEDFNKRVS
jgi:hypothetical protein